MKRLSRREVLAWAAAAGLLPACGPRPAPRDPAHLPEQTPSRDPKPASEYADSVDALCDVLLPAERDSDDRIVSAGAREAGVDRVLEVEAFARLAVAQGFVAPLRDEVLTALDDLNGAARAVLNRALDARAQLERPLSRFHELDRPTQERIVDRAFDDDATRPALQVLRAACFVAYLGAVATDAGLQAIGFPPFEDFDDRRAVSGYPRTRAGRLVDAATEDLGSITDLDDYTVNRAPTATPGDDLALVLTAEGDLR